MEMIRKMFMNKRAETESSIILDVIYLLLGAIVFMFMVYIIVLMMQYFWPPPDTDLIAMNGVANLIEFSLQNIPVAYGDTLLVPLPFQLKEDSALKVISPGYENNPAPQICIIQKEVLKNCRTINVQGIESMSVVGTASDNTGNTGFIFTPKNHFTQILTISLHRNPVDIHKGSYNINLVIPATER